MLTPRTSSNTCTGDDNNNDGGILNNAVNDSEDDRTGTLSNADILE